MLGHKCGKRMSCQPYGQFLSHLSIFILDVFSKIKMFAPVRFQHFLLQHDDLSFKAFIECSVHALKVPGITGEGISERSAWSIQGHECSGLYLHGSLSFLLSFIHLKPTGTLAFCTRFNLTINRPSDSSQHFRS